MTKEIQKLDPLRDNFLTMVKKHNALVDAVNELQKHEEQHLDLLTQLNEMRLHQTKKVDIGELAYLQKENSDLKDEVEKLQKQLNIATSGLNAVHYTIVNNNDLLGTVYRMKNIAGESLDELKGGDND